MKIIFLMASVLLLASVPEVSKAQSHSNPPTSEECGDRLYNDLQKCNNKYYMCQDIAILVKNICMNICGTPPDSICETDCNNTYNSDMATCGNDLYACNVSAFDKYDDCLEEAIN